MMALLTQHKNKVTVVGSSPLLGAVEWSKASGGDLTHTITKLRRTAGAAKEVLAADSEFDNVTTEAYVDPAAHSDLLVALKAGEPVEYFGCSVAKSTLPAADSNGEDPAMLVIEWAVGS